MTKWFLKARLLAGLFASMMVFTHAPVARAAVTTSFDHSDLWWNAAESGWGAQLQQQGDVIFMTLYVYAADGSATWFVASDMRQQFRPGSPPDTWQGDLYKTAGPAYAGAFDPSSVTQARVGTATLEFPTAVSGTLRYTVDGTEVVKTISRLTFRANTPAPGGYHGGLSGAFANCALDGQDGPIDLLGAMTVSVAQPRVTLTFTSELYAGLPSRCTFTGDHRQDGRLGSIAGSFSCSIFYGGDDRNEAPRSITKSGAFTLSEIEANAGGVFGKLTAADQDCKLTGFVGGVRLP